MKILFFILFALFFESLHANEMSTYFGKSQGCFLLFNVKTQKFEKTLGESNCKERLPACSTFKVPLAVMAIDAGIVKDETQIFKWDGKKRFREEWNKNQTPKTWMRESTVWVSQELTPKLGKEKFQKYLNDFQYGNADINSGLTTAWLQSPDDKNGALKINAYEQVDFMKKLWSSTLPSSKESQSITRDLTYLETSPAGFKLSGKTGSGFYKKDRNLKIGWFIAHVSSGDKEYIAVANLHDVSKPGNTEAGGPRVREIMKKILRDGELW